MRGAFISDQVRNPDKLYQDSQQVLQELITNPEKSRYDQENIALSLIQQKVDKTKWTRDEAIKNGLMEVIPDKKKGQVINPRTNQIINPVKKFDK